MHKSIVLIALSALAFAPIACEETATNTEPRSLEGPPEIVADVDSPEFVGKMLSCFDGGEPTSIEYRDGDPVGAVMVQEIEIRFTAYAHVSIGACLRDALLDAGGQVP